MFILIARKIVEVLEKKIHKKSRIFIEENFFYPSDKHPRFENLLHCIETKCPKWRHQWRKEAGGTPWTSKYAEATVEESDVIKYLFN